MRNVQFATALILLISMFGCAKYSANDSSLDPEKKITPRPEVIYGKDNRKDFFQIDDENWQDMSLSTVALVDQSDIKYNKNKKHYILDTKIYGEDSRLCSDEPYFFQPKVSFCSGFLVGPNVVVTAGHCIRTEEGCKRTHMVFDYLLDNPEATIGPFPKNNVYKCKEIIKQEENGITGMDYAIIRLDREVKGRNPLPVRQQGQVNNDDDLTVIGYPSGLPLKLAGQGSVLSNTEKTYFVTNLDTYGGNSGSAVINTETRIVEGILVRGERDFIYDKEEKCRRSKVCKNDGGDCRGEDVVRIEFILDHLTPADLQ